MRRSIRIGRAPCSLAGSACCGCRMLSMSGPRAPRLLPTSVLRPASSTGGPGPVSVFATPRSQPGGRTHPKLSTHQTRRFNSKLWASFSPLFGAPVAPVSRQTSPRSVPRLAGRALVWNPSGSVRRDPKLNSRRPVRTLGQTRPARQGLVRVPESNTKYGGKRGKSGAYAAPAMPTRISDSS